MVDAMRTAVGCLVAFALTIGAASADELTVFVTGSMADPFEELGADFTAEHGHTLKFSLGTTGGVLAKIRSGERGDVIVVAAEAASELEANGVIVAGTRRPVASSLFGIVVRADRPAPDVSTPDKLRQVVLAARTISYPDPVVATISGGYVETVLDQLGIKDQARGKASLKPMGYLVGEAVQRGEAELGLSFISEFTKNEALQVARFPAELQKPQLYAAGVLAGATNPAAARELIAFVTSAAVRDKLTAAGVVPAGTDSN